MYYKEVGMKNDVKILDVIALTGDIPDQNLIKGQVGTIVEQLDENIYEVEFSDNNGKTYSSLSLSSEQFIILHYELAKAV